MKPRHNYLLLILHAHLPYVRHPEQDWCYEETWLFEALTETYLPLLALCTRLHQARVPARLTLSISPTLAAMWRDPLLQARYRAHLDKSAVLAEREMARARGDVTRLAVVRHYAQRIRTCRTQYQALAGDLAKAFAYWQDAGIVELCTTAATHGLLPLLRGQPGAVRAQIRIAAQAHASEFGRPAHGFWLPECGYYPGVEEELRAAGFRYFIVDSHGLPGPTTMPVLCPNGVAALGRDPDASAQVWSAEQGYPADPVYRDFHTDLCHETPPVSLEPLIPASAGALPTGFKYYRILANGGVPAHGGVPTHGGVLARHAKALYNPTLANAKAHAHAAHFVASRQAALSAAGAFQPLPAVCVAPYDAELFGHWWHEGLQWLEYVIRAVAAEPTLHLATPLEYLAEYGVACPYTQPLPSTWGAHGHHGYWLNRKTDWLYPLLRQAAEQMRQLCQSHPHAQRGLQAAARALLLAQASDWPFLITSGTAGDYPRHRVEQHLDRFAYLAQAIRHNTLCDTQLQDIWALAPLFPHLEYHHFSA